MFIVKESDKNSSGHSNGQINIEPEEESGLLSPVGDHHTEKPEVECGPDVHDIDTQCGFWVFQTSVLQPCARIQCFTGFYSLAALITSTLSVYVNSQITTLERQFGFSSTQTGLIMAANDVGFLVCVLFLSYSVAKFHIPRSLGIATGIFGISGLACCLPFFLFRSSIEAMVADFSNSRSDNLTSIAVDDGGRNKPLAMFGGLCLPNETEEISLGSESVGHVSHPQNVTVLPSRVVSASLAIIFCGMMLQGFGKSPRYSFTVTYIDSNTGKTNTGFYMGIIIASAIFGPTLAYALGGVFSRIFVTLEETTLTPQHPRWVGAWWLGYIVCGVFALLASLPLMWFPRRLPPRPGRHDNNVDNSAGDGGEAKILDSPVSVISDKGPEVKDEQNELNKMETPVNNVVFYISHLKSFLACLSRLLTNVIYMSIVGSSCFDIFSVSGLSAYTPKYIERQFDLPTYKANYILSANVLCAACLGTFIGGYLSRRLKMTALPALLFALVVECVAMGGGALGFVFACDQPTVHNWPETPQTCNVGCGCEDNSFFAVCGSDGKTYYSPCAAGCQGIENGVYQNCTCIPGLGEATGGMCSYGCNHLYTYFAAITIRGLFGTLSIIPKLVVYIRCVLPKDKGLAVGLSSFMTSLLGWLLGPIIFGSVIDGICTVWDVTSPGVRGRCLLYDNDVFRVKLHGYSTVSLFASNICLLIGYIYAHCTGCLDNPPGDLDKGQYQKVKSEINDDPKAACEL